jgi:hypothetical protein
MCRFVLAAALLAGASFPAFATTTVTKGTLTVVISPSALALLMNGQNPAFVNAACSAPASTVVASLSTTGGDGSAVMFGITGGDTTDFTISGSSVVVGQNGISSSDCGQSETLTVSASQN